MKSEAKSEKRLQVYSVLKLSEGGPGQGNALKLLKDAGLTVRAASSVLDRHDAVAVIGDEQEQRRANQILRDNRVT
jgi:hypothetical protein